MNNKYFLLLLITVFYTSTSWAQSTNGYGQLTWGATIADALALYPNLTRERTAIADPRNPMTDFSDIGVQAYSERNAVIDIDKRIFFFYNGELFLVREQYNTRNINLATIRNRIESVYGPLTEKPAERFRTRGPGGIYVNITLNGYTFIRNNLEIEISLVEGSALFIRRPGIVVEYRNPYVYRQVLAAR